MLGIIFSSSLTVVGYFASIGLVDITKKLQQSDQILQPNYLKEKCTVDLKKTFLNQSSTILRRKHFSCPSHVVAVALFLSAITLAFVFCMFFGKLLSKLTLLLIVMSFSVPSLQYLSVERHCHIVDHFFRTVAQNYIFLD